MFQEIQIQPRDVYEHFVYVQRPRTTLHWSFTTRKKNIHFGLFWRGGPAMTATTSQRHQKQLSNFPESRRILGPSSSTIEPLTPNGDNQQQKDIAAGTDTSLLTKGQQQQHATSSSKGKRNSLTQNTALHQSRRKSTASLHLIENKFQEVIPISHTHSSEEQIRGSYMATEPGNCVLIFDNTTSINTSKILRFTVTSDEPIQENTRLNRSHDMAGYLLKKRRKRMQGWAKRWFELLPNGTLSYSVAPGGIKRGSIQITMTMITIYPKQRTIHLDTGTTIYHLKALTKEDFDKWVDEFRRQRAISHRDKSAGIMVDGAWLLPDNRYRLTPNPIERQQIGNKNDNNNNAINDCDDFDEDEDGDNDDDDFDDQYSNCDIFGIGEERMKFFEESQQNLEQDFKQMAHDLENLSIGLQNMKNIWIGPSSAHTTIGNTSSSSSSPASSPTNSKRRFTFRRGSTQPPVSTHPLCINQGGVSNISTSLSNQQQHQQIPNDFVDSSSIATYPQMAAANAATSTVTLDSLMESLQHIIELRSTMELEYGKQQRCWKELKKQRHYGSSHYSQQHQGAEFGTPRSLSFYSYHSSNHSDLYYDAEEFEMTLDEDDDSELVEEKDYVDDDESSLEEIQNDDNDSLISNSTTIKQQSSLQDPSSPLPERPAQTIQRRTILPHPVAGKNVNLLSLLRKNIGKDLSTITMPISLNEPLNLLQRLCEELEYSDLLDKANGLDDSLGRLMYVAIFSISGFASSQYRVGRKFWNPLLFETYECLRPDKGFRFVSEKVSHRPNIMACHAESSNFTFWQSTEGSTKFWGKSMEFISEGTVNVKLPKHGDHFTYTKPSSHMRNMLFGTRYLEHLGQTKVTNHTTGDYAVVTFKEARRNGGDGYYFGGGGAQWERNEVEVLFYTGGSATTPVRKIVGKWSQSLSQDLGDQQYKLLWQVQPPTVYNPTDYYGFTQFCMELNEITPLEQNHLPPTDTRLRPDQSLFEKGDVDQAEKEKDRVEVLQRERRNQYEDSGITPVPLWFQPSKQDPSQWEYKGGYWEARKSGQWPSETPNLW